LYICSVLSRSLSLSLSLSLCCTYESKGFLRFSLILKRRFSNEKIQYLYCAVKCTVSRDDRTIKIMLFHQSAAQAMKKHVIVTLFVTKIIRTYLYITCNKKILFLKKYFSHLWVFTDFSILLLLSEHKHCDNAATNSNSENARSRMVASLWGSVRTGTKEGESSIGRVWAAGFHNVTARSHLARVFKLMNHFPLIFQFFFFWPRIRRSTCIYKYQMKSLEDIQYIKNWHICNSNAYIFLYW